MSEWKQHELAVGRGYAESNVTASSAGCSPARVLPARCLGALSTHTQVRPLPQSWRGKSQLISAS